MEERLDINEKEVAIYYSGIREGVRLMHGSISTWVHIQSNLQLDMAPLLKAFLGEARYKEKANIEALRRLIANEEKRKAKLENGI